MFLNIILAFSNIIGFYVVYLNNSNDKIFNIILTCIIIASFIHHLTETNQVNHNLRQKIYYIDNYGDELRYIDMIIAYSLFIYIIYRIGIKKLSLFVCDYKLIIFIAFLFNFLCDFVITDQKYIYLIFHLIWHVLIYYIIYLLSFKIKN